MLLYNILILLLIISLIIGKVKCIESKFAINLIKLYL